VSAEHRGLAAWFAAAVLLLLLAHLGAVPAATQGAAIGVAIGAMYASLLWRRTRAVALADRRAVAAARAGALARFAFVFLAFAVAHRVWPTAGLAWAAGCFVVPLITRMVGLARGVGL
jgi:hypothetical protein